jgi:serine phosphatase RsbU (regulator of sigma subunit)
MELSRKIQTSLLPTSTENLHPELEISAAMIPADHVGGDFYDITFDKTGSLWVAVGDVSGHGVTPGLIMMMAQTVHTTVTTNLDCDARSVVVKINEILYKNVNERLNETHFMTFTALKYLGAGRFQYAGAHLSMIVFRQKTGTCELIKTKGVYLNFKKDISRATKNSEFSLDPGDTLVLYTDGLTEAENSDGNLLDIDGFLKIIEKHAHRIPEAMRDTVMADVVKWCGNRRADDMSLVIVRRNEAGQI